MCRQLADEVSGSNGTEQSFMIMGERKRGKDTSLYVRLDSLDCKYIRGATSATVTTCIAVG
jgi:hypothetical protein